MIAYEGWDIVGGRVPSGFGKHGVVDGFPINFKSLESDVFHLAVCVISVDYRQVWSAAFIADATKSDVFNTSAWSCAVFLVESYFHLKETALKNLFNAYVVEQYFTHYVVVATVDGKTPLIVYLWLALTEYVDVFIKEIFYCVTSFGVAMNANEDRVGYVSPKCGILHSYVSCITTESLASGIGGGAIIAVTTEYAIILYIL